MSPEVMNSGKTYDSEDGNPLYYGYCHSADWWSLGVITYSMKFLRKPFVQPEARMSGESSTSENVGGFGHNNMER